MILRSSRSIVVLLAIGACTRAPALFYDVGIDPRTSSNIQVNMQILHGPASARVAMAIHPEYNDRYWRYIHDLKANGVDKRAILAIDKENIWRVISHVGYAQVNYRIEPAAESPTNRPVWHTVIRPDGGSINTIDTFLYLADYPRAPVRIRLSSPVRVFWDVPGDNGAAMVSDGFFGTTPGGVFQQTFETDAETLLDSPILYGNSIRFWRFRVDGIPHTIAYWPLANATPFDTTAFVDAIEKVAREAVAVFGKPPYPHYSFLLEDGAWGALEHRSSVTIGMPSRDLAKDPRMYLPELAHEFFHTWNLIRLYPEGRGQRLSADPTPHTKGLWLSEGVTIYYAEALTRRAGFPERNMARKDLLAEELESYYATPGNVHISPEVASERAVDTTGINGDYEVNYYAQGRLIGTALDLILRDSTRGQKGLDDFMRAMYDRFALKRGFTTDDVERTASDVCRCNLRWFFDDHVRNPRPIDFSTHLRTIGLRIQVDTVAASDSSGSPLPDTRIWAYPRRSDRRMRVWLQDPSSVWGRAGLHTGQDLVAFNGVAVDSFPDFRRAFRTIRVGSDVPVDIVNDGKPQRITVRVTGYQRPRVTISDDPGASPAQIERRKRWELAH
jgi:predicted metalloprotease with PDZ domain